jgi:Peptidoglycan-binding protein, CsiV
MIKTVGKSILLWFVAWLPVVVLAQDQLLDEEQAEVKLYTVEVIVFSYAENVSVGSEVFPPDVITVANPADPAPLVEIEVQPQARRHPDFIGLEPKLLGADSFTMQKLAEKFELLDAYKPVLHVAWTQPGYPQSDAIAMPVAGFGASAPGLDGSFTLYLGRFLHLVVDLSLAAADNRAEYEDEHGVVRQFEYTLSPAEGPVNFRIREDRILKNDEVRYFDHPKFGVIAKVQRVETATGSAGATSRPPSIGKAGQ